MGSTESKEGEPTPILDVQLYDAYLNQAMWVGGIKRERLAMPEYGDLVYFVEAVTTISSHHVNMYDADRMIQNFIDDVNYGTLPSLMDYLRLSKERLHERGCKVPKEYTEAYKTALRLISIGFERVPINLPSYAVVDRLLARVDMNPVLSLRLEIAALRKEVAEVKEAIMYQPGRELMQEVQKDFESKIKK